MIKEQKVLALAFLESQPDIVAKILEKQLSTDVALFLNKISTVSARMILEKMMPQYAAQTCKHLKVKSVGKILSKMEIHFIVAILRFIEKDKQSKIVQYLAREKKESVKKLLQFSVNTVGAWMLSPVLTIRKETCINDILKILKQNKDSFFLEKIFIVDNNQRFLGSIMTCQLFNKRSNVTAQEIIQTRSDFVYGHENLDSVENHIGWQIHDNLPVVTKDLHVIGVIRSLDLRNALNQNVPEINIEPTYDTSSEIYDIYSKSITILLEVLDNMIRNK